MRSRSDLLEDRDNARSVEQGSRRDPGFLIEIKIDQIAQNSGDISQKRLDFSYFLFGAFD
jgi:hypothetical protein